MSGKEIERKHHHTFEEIKQEGEDGSEFWMARRLSKILEYAEFRNFLPVIANGQTYFATQTEENCAGKMLKERRKPMRPILK